MFSHCIFGLPVALVYTSNVQQKRGGGGNSTSVHREGNLGMFPQNTFLSFICRFKVRVQIVKSRVEHLLVSIFSMCCLDCGRPIYFCYDFRIL